MFTRESPEEIAALVSCIVELLRCAFKEINAADFSETVAHLLGDVMRGIDKARGAKKGEEKWTRQEVLQLLEAIKVTMSKK
jgi:hypothetical protein